MTLHAAKPDAAHQKLKLKAHAAASALIACTMALSAPTAWLAPGPAAAWADTNSEQASPPDQESQAETPSEEPEPADKPTQDDSSAGKESEGGAEQQPTTQKPDAQNNATQGGAAQNSPRPEAAASNDSAERDEASGNAAESYRFSNGMPSNASSTEDEAAAMLSSSPTWTKVSAGTWKLTGASAYIPYGTTHKAKGLGIDVSQWNGTINWKSVKASGVDFAIIRCGWGGNYTKQDDIRFLQNVAGAQQAGVKIGVYLYSYATSTTMAESEAAHTLRLLKQAGLTPGKLAFPVYFDTEDKSTAWMSRASLSAVADAYCKKIKAAGYTPGIYASSGWLFSHLEKSVYEKYDLWVACWSRSCAFTGSYGMWQCLSDGRVPGISGDTDMNFVYRDPLNAVKKTKAKTYKISYVLSGGTNAKGNPSKYKNTSKTFKLKSPTKKNYTFKGWYTNKQLTKRITSVKKGSKRNLKLYAKWKRKGYYVRVTAPVGLLVRTGPGTDFPTAQLYLAQSKLWIISEKQVGDNLWGKLANGTGWVCLTHTKKA